MNAHLQLTHNAIMYISVGFQQTCLLQILSLRHAQTSHLQMIVYDGLVYAGALYQYSSSQASEKFPLTCSRSVKEEIETLKEGKKHKLFPKQYDIIQVRANIVGKYQPLHILELKIVHTDLFEVIGNEVLCLEQYMRRRRFINDPRIDEQDLQQLERPQKRLNTSHEIDFKSDNSLIPEIISTGNLHQLNQNHTHQTGQIKHTIYQGLEIIEQNCNSKENTSPSDGNLGKDLSITQFVSKNSKKSVETFQFQIMGIGNIQDQNGQKQSIENRFPQQEERTQKKGDCQIQEIQLDEDCQITEVNPEKKKKEKVINLISQIELDSNPPTTKNKFTSIKRQNKQSFIMVTDLYERMHRFRILCRINQIINFRSLKGTLCTKLMLVDEVGDQITCILFERAHQSQSARKVSFLKGRTYIFENGEVEKDDQGHLNISVPWSGIHETKLILQSFNPRKMMRVGQIESIQSSHFFQKAIQSNSKSINNQAIFSREIHVCGILKGLKDQPKLINNQFRLNGILCDPDQEKSVLFTLFLDQLSIFPAEGAVISLHNMRVAKHERTLKLDQSRRSYYLVENNNNHPYFSDLFDVSRKQTWKLKQYKNLSEVTFVPRTIVQLKEILSKTVQYDKCFSEIDCNIASITEKRQYSACATCHHETKPEKGQHTYCYHCKKIGKWLKRFQFSSQVADSTSSIEVLVYSEEIQHFINVPVIEYSNMSRQDRLTLLELSSYQNVLLRVKSERSTGGSTHYVVRSERVNHKRGLEQIKQHQIHNKTKYLPKW